MVEQDAPGWLVREGAFSPANVRKYESILCQGNGYMGVRASLEEDYPLTRRGTFVAGTFDFAEDKKTTQLPAGADTTAVQLTVNGTPLSIPQENTMRYARWLDLRDGSLHREFLCSPEPGLRVEVVSERFVSLRERHLLGARLRVKVLEGEADLSLATGISNGEAPETAHFCNHECLASGDILQHTAVTHESRILFVTSAWVELRRRDASGRETPVPKKLQQSPAQILVTADQTLKTGETLELEKLCRIATSRDLDCESPKELPRREREAMAALREQGYHRAFSESAQCWEALWRQREVAIDGPEEDKLAVRFAVYHLAIMAPRHDSRMSIGAKGLTGKGYNGHIFWDTEIYLLPYYMWTDPQAARSMLGYRYHSLDSARRLARQTGFAGARYPWEAGWITDGETCPEPEISDTEVHVTADVAYAVCRYYAVTGDADFMRRWGGEMLFETAEFWRSRLTPKGNGYEIRDVIGPDEFSRHGNNNAYTNYLAQRNFQAAAHWQERLRREFPQDYARLDARLALKDKAPLWRACAEKLTLPKVDARNILPQDDTYLTLPKVDLTPYRAGTRKLRQDYPAPTYSDIQVSKQADVVNLLLLLEDRFSQDVKRANLEYYEPLCVHESSLSLCAYATLAAQCRLDGAAYRMFRRACEVDLGPNMRSSDDGIHAAAIGGIWQCCVLGFCGVGMENGRLKIAPRLPEAWKRMEFQICWQGRRLKIALTHTEAWVQVLSGPEDLTVQTEKGLLTAKKFLKWPLI